MRALHSARELFLIWQDHLVALDPAPAVQWSDMPGSDGKNVQRWWIHRLLDLPIILHSNLMKYALNLEPNTPSVLGISMATVTGFLRLTVGKSPAVTDVSFSIAVNGDLTKPADWTSAGTTVDQNTATIFQTHDNLPIAPGSHRFVRLKVTRP